MSRVHGWRPVALLLFRLSAVYLCLYAIGPVLQVIGRRGLSFDLTFPLQGLYWTAWDPVVSWVGVHVLGIGPVRWAESGGSDGPFYWVHALCLLAVSLLTAVVWTVRSRRREHPVAYNRIRTALRLVLAFTLIEYGSSKVFYLQFGPPSLRELVLPLGQFPPMELIWTAIGSSRAYSVYGGALELLAGVLLLFRRTSLLGALVAVGVLSNVVMLNVSFDIPVKLYSLHLMFMALFIAAGDARRLVDFFVLERSAALPPRPRDPSPAVARRRALASSAIAAFAILPILSQDWEGLHTYGARRPLPALHGLYEVTALEGPVQAPAPLGWIAIDRGAHLIFADRSHQFRTLTVDTAGRHLTLRERGADQADEFSYTPSADGMALRGTLAGDSVHIMLRRMGRDEFPLLRQPFRWVNRR